MSDLARQFGQIDIYLFDQLLRGRLMPPMRVLDAGCGHGRNLVYLLQAGFEVFAVDEDPDAVREVRGLAAQLAPGVPAANFRAEPVERMTFPDGCADCVISSAVLHFAEDEAQLANPEQSIEFVERTGVDIFAPAIGTAHGVYKTKNPKIDFERLAIINKMLNSNGVKTPVVVHGGTGLPEDYIKKLLAAGGAKFNVSTELKHTLIDAKFEYISTHRDEYDPGKIDVAVRDATRKVVMHWMDMLGSTGKA